MGRGLKTIIIGLVIGISGSLALTRLIAGFLFGVANTDPMTYSIVAVILTTVALVACYIPAYRAAKVDPMTALRQEYSCRVAIHSEGILAENSRPCRESIQSAARSIRHYHEAAGAR